MKTYLKSVVFAVGIMATTLAPSVNAGKPTRTLNFKLTVVGQGNKKLTNLKIILKDNEKSAANNEATNRFAMKLAPKDASEFSIQYKFGDQEQVASCMVSGTPDTMPQNIIATIDPEKSTCAMN